ncbi:MAG: PQQ-binding-like beta-propeller repeat protein [Gemmatimonadota bacterium]|nr:PQQ-binding-like beta-propeller repeat protein [Gemmatimonadota bacterium]
MSSSRPGLVVAAVVALGVMAACTAKTSADGDVHSSARVLEGSAPPIDAHDPDARMQRLMADSASWPSYGRDYSNQRFSPLTQISAASVKGMSLAWHYKTGVVKAFETSPVVVDGVMYITTAVNHVIALDAATGTKKWEWVADLGTTIICCGPVNRGVAVYGGRVYVGTLDARLVALDAATGRQVWEAQVGDNTRGYSITMAPLAVKGLVITGVSGAEYGIRGYVTAYDAKTGKLAWRWNTVPSPDEGGWWGKWKTTDPFGTPLGRDIAAEKADSAKYPDAWKTGGGSVWQTPAVDLARNLMVLTVNNPSPDVDGVVRPGDNLYTDCIVALDLMTGKLKWYFQEVPHDLWDYDPISPPILVDVRDSTGTMVPAVAEAGKTGWVYVVNRLTGAPIRRSDEFVPHNGTFRAPTRDGTLIAPGGNGGSEWSPAAVNPALGYMYVLGLNEPDVYKLRPEKLKNGASWLTGVWLNALGDKASGTFSAVDLNTGHIAWQQKMQHRMVGGALATAGGVVFVGSKERVFYAFDAQKGDTLWHYLAPAGINAPPVSYAIGGRQYIAVAAGGVLQINSPRGDELLVFALPTSADTSFAVTASRGSTAATILSRR